MNALKKAQLVISKVPEATFLFWIIKIAATTLGETGGDLVSMSLNWGYLISTLLFAALFCMMVLIQIKTKILALRVFALNAQS